MRRSVCILAWVSTTASNELKVVSKVVNWEAGGGGTAFTENRTGTTDRDCIFWSDLHYAESGLSGFLQTNINAINTHLSREPLSELRLL